MCTHPLSTLFASYKKRKGRNPTVQIFGTHQNHGGRIRVKFVKRILVVRHVSLCWRTKMNVPCLKLNSWSGRRSAALDGACYIWIARTVLGPRWHLPVMSDDGDFADWFLWSFFFTHLIFQTWLLHFKYFKTVEIWYKVYKPWFNFFFSLA